MACLKKMSQDRLVNLECTKCKHTTHHTFKNKKVHKERMELSKHCKYCGKHTVHKETK